MPKDKCQHILAGACRSIKTPGTFQFTPKKPVYASRMLFNSAMALA